MDYKKTEFKKKKLSKEEFELKKFSKKKNLMKIEK
jgi:hypothetical protein